jgi:sugar phosphate permease
MWDETRETDPLRTNSPSHVRVYVSLWLAGVAAIAYLCRTSIAVAEQTIRESLHVSEDDMGFVLGPAFFWSYALAQIPTAWLGERYGSRLMLPLFAITSALATLMFGLAPSLLFLVTARVLMGVAQAGTFPCATQTISHWHPLSERARASGLLGGAMQIGHGIGLVLTGALIGIVGWRSTFAIFAIPGLLWAGGFGAWFRNYPGDHPGINDAERRHIEDNPPSPAPLAERVRERTPWDVLATSPAMRLICGQQFFRAAGQVFFASWFVTYLQETRDVSLKDSAMLTAIPVIAMMLASLTGGGVSDWVYRRTGSLQRARRGVAASSLFLCAAIVSAAFFVNEPLPAVCMISVGVFCAGFAGPCAYSVTIDMGGRHVPAVFATMNMIGNFGAGLLAWAAPPFRSFVEGHLTGFEDPQRTSWNTVLLLFAAMYLAAALCWTRLNVAGSVFDQSQNR